MRVIRKHSVPLWQRRTRPVHADGSFDFPTQSVGTTKWTGQDGGPVTVYFDPSLPDDAQSKAQDILSRMDDLMAYLDQVFAVQGKAGNVIIAAVNGATDGSGGAYHYDCGFDSDTPGGSDWYEDYSSDTVEIFGLVMAEVSESYMGLQGKGWNCGGSGGEGLSRFLAEIVSGGPNGSLAAYATGPSYDGSNWIDQDQGTDQDYPSIGCSILYLWWMVSQGYTPAQICQAGEPDGTLASNWGLLTGKDKSGAWPAFQQAIQAVGQINSDNPWNTATPPYPLPKGKP